MFGSIHRQRGMSMSGILFVLAVLGIAFTVVVKLGPHYLEFETVKSVMNGIEEDPDLASMGRQKILDSIDSKLYINNVTDVTRKDFSFKKVKNGTELLVEYEVRKPLFGNLDAVMRFAHQIALDGR